MDPKSPQQEDGRKVYAFAFGLVAQLGFMIALPIAVLAYAGRVADRAWGTSPLFLLAGAALAVAVSGIWVARRSRLLRDQYLRMFADSDKNRKV